MKEQKIFRLKISEFIPLGQENAISMKELAKITNSDNRTVRLLVQRAREAGEPICSTCNCKQAGYYIPLSSDEAAIYLRQQQARIKTARKSLCGVLKFIANSKGKGKRK